MVCALASNAADRAANISAARAQGYRAGSPPYNVMLLWVHAIDSNNARTDHHITFHATKMEDSVLVLDTAEYEHEGGPDSARGWTKWIVDAPDDGYGRD
jgi:hypothetical protein